MWRDGFFFGFFYSSFDRQFSTVTRKKNENGAFLRIYACVGQKNHHWWFFFCFFFTFPSDTLFCLCFFQGGNSSNTWTFLVSLYFLAEIFDWEQLKETPCIYFICFLQTFQFDHGAISPYLMVILCWKTSWPPYQLPPSGPLWYLSGMFQNNQICVKSFVTNLLLSTEISPCIRVYFQIYIKYWMQIYRNSPEVLGMC